MWEEHNSIKGNRFTPVNSNYPLIAEGECIHISCMEMPAHDEFCMGS